MSLTYVHYLGRHVRDGLIIQKHFSIQTLNSPPPTCLLGFQIALHLRFHKPHVTNREETTWNNTGNA